MRNAGVEEPGRGRAALLPVVRGELERAEQEPLACQVEVLDLEVPE